MGKPARNNAVRVNITTMKRYENTFDINNRGMTQYRESCAETRNTEGTRYGEDEGIMNIKPLSGRISAETGGMAYTGAAFFMTRTAPMWKVTSYRLARN